MSEKQNQYVTAGGLKISKCLYDLVSEEIAPGTGIEPEYFWQSLANIVADYGDKNQRLLDKRDQLQARIDDWHSSDHAKHYSVAENRKFLSDIGYLVTEGPAFKVEVENVDREISDVSAPQLVVPVDNARYALNAANARWGSLYDALYTSGVAEPEDIPAAPPAQYDADRGARVIQWARDFLDRVVPLKSGSHAQASSYIVAPAGRRTLELKISLQNGEITSLKSPGQFAGFLGLMYDPSEILLYNNGLFFRLMINRDSMIGEIDSAGISDIAMEAAVTTIQDFEDAVSAVDAEDKTVAYRNWLYLMKGTLTAEFEKNGKTVKRSLNPDMNFTNPYGLPTVVSARSMMLVRHVGIHMYTDAVTTLTGELIPEGFLDAMVISLCAIHNLFGEGAKSFPNSRCGNVYVVKPKLHGPEEVAATAQLFSRVEDVLNLNRNTLKIGIMDEERRTTANLKESIREARNRVIFINTGFLDRTGDEIHTMMNLGPSITKDEMKKATWLHTYENWNVEVGVETGVYSVGQIGKGMWTMPDLMKTMYNTKTNHPKAGANTAWVPSPTLAVIHALHYHEINVLSIQRTIGAKEKAKLDDILSPPVLREELSSEQIEMELENNAQSILGYVVHWVEEGIGCSKIPDINEINLMEDRATLRIASQLIASWLRHRLTTREQVVDIFKRIAVIVDNQNEGATGYRKMAPDYDSSVGFQAALDLVFQGIDSPNGYTEPILHARRREAKALHSS